MMCAMLFCLTLGLGSIMKEDGNEVNSYILQRRAQEIESTPPPPPPPATSPPPPLTTEDSTPPPPATFESARPGTCCTQSPSHTVLWTDFESSVQATGNQSKGLPLVVPCGTKVVVDKSPNHELHGLQVLGDLTFQDGEDVTISTAFVFVCGNFSIGSPTQSHESKVEIVLTGSTEVTWKMQNGMLMNFGRTGFITYGGFTHIRGKACGATSWTRLASPLSTDAAAGAGTEPNGLATNEEASQSSLGHHRYTASKAVDGVRHWKWSAMLTRREANPWWQVRIPAVSSGVGVVKIWPRRGRYFDGHDDGAIVGVTDIPCAGDGLCGGTLCGRIAEEISTPPYVVNCGGATGSYVYVQLPGQHRELGMEEVEVFPTPVGTTRALEVRGTSKPMSWGPGDKLVITSSSWNPLETEDVTLESVEGSRVNFVGSIAHHHDGCSSCVVAAEVASMSRNIVIRGEEGCAPTCGHFQMAHTHTGFVCGAEFTNLGQKVTEGRYPLHIHMPGEAETLTVKDNALHHNHNRGIVLHGVHRMLVESNLCYKTNGHCFMLEDGVEQYNRIIENLGILPSPQHFGCSHSHDMSFTCAHRSDHSPNAFWISNPLNHFEGNVGIAEQGAIFTETRHVMGLTRREFRAEAMKVGREGKIKGNVPFLVFKNNVAHSSELGLGNYPRFNWGQINGHTTKYEQYTAWRCGLGVQVHGSLAVPLVDGATLFENHAGFSASTTETRVHTTNSRIKARDSHSWPVIMKKVGFTREADILQIFADTDNYTRNWVRCYGAFSEAKLSGIFTNISYVQPCDEIAYSP